MSVRRLERIVLISAAAEKLASFYAAAFGFEVLRARTVDEAAFGALVGTPGARAHVVSLRLGAQHVDLVQVSPRGLPYPANVAGPSVLFQHFAIEVSDVPQALARLATQSGWKAISTDGPQHLPPASGGVTAFKFRDPECHPLELISAGRRDGEVDGSRIAHSALTVASTARSIAFYARLGLRTTGGSLNIGIEQERLDAVPAARVQVTALGFIGGSEPHVELLCYEHPRVPVFPALQPHDVAADWLVLPVDSEPALRQLLLRVDSRGTPTRFEDGSVRCLLPDPDGHWLCLEVPAGA